MPKTKWPQHLTDFFITALVDECRAGNRPHKTLNSLGRQNVLKRLRDYTGRDWTWEPCKSKWHELKKRWNSWKYLHTFSGLGYHPHTGAIDMPEEWWADKEKVHKVAKVFKQARLEREEDLDVIFAKMEPVNVGPREDGGHERGRAGVPTHYVDSDDSNDSEADLQMHNSNPSPPQPTRLTTRTSESTGKRKASDPMDSRASFLEGFKTFYHDVSDWKTEKQTSRASKKAEEDSEYEQFMKELLDGGVNPDSHEYFMASEVLVDITRRGAYRPLPTIEAKLAWIKRAYLMKIGQPPM
ncbi:hypothetical protein BS78_09G119300 [Paspalum vaginatum]|nr:hypothetical protein BS78_09G119300 [Paspalum vaginatum]